MRLKSFFDKWRLTLLTIDQQALQLLGYDLSNDELMTELESDFKRMRDIMKTNPDIK